MSEKCSECGIEIRTQTEGVRAGKWVHYWSGRFWGEYCPSPMRTKGKPKNPQPKGDGE